MSCPVSPGLTSVHSENCSVEARLSDMSWPYGKQATDRRGVRVREDDHDTVLLCQGSRENVHMQPHLKKEGHHANERRAQTMTCTPHSHPPPCIPVPTPQAQ